MKNTNSAPHHDQNGSHGHEHDHHPTPVGRLWQFLRVEKSDLLTLIAYAMIAGILALVVPLTAQALVNTIAAGVLVQPLVVLSLLTLVGLLLSGVLQLMKLSLAETVQQRLFARTSLQMADKLPRLLGSSLRGEYAPELVNRFFDTLTVQKALSKLLLDGLTALLQAMVGLVLLAFYSPYLLGLDIGILIFLAFVVGILGIGGLRTSIQESAEKYRVASWLEDMARCQADLKLHGANSYLLHRADNTVMRYLEARRSHFRVLWRQAFGNYLFQAVASAAVLAVGGWLVINRKLTLGQLVAAQLVVVSLLAALDKLIRQADQVFDLLTGLEKVGHVLDMPTERVGGVPVPRNGNTPPALAVRGVRFSYQPESLPDTLTGLTLSVAPGERVCIVGESGAGKSTLAGLIAGLEIPTHGEITIGGVDVRDADLADLRRVLSLARAEDAVFDGTLEENIAVGREHVSHSDVREAIEMAQLAGDVARLPNGVSTMLISGGEPLSRGQRQRLLLARALAGNPRFLLFDEAFNGMDEAMATKIMSAIYAPERSWSILSVTHKAEAVMRSQMVYVLHGGAIVESGPPDTLARTPESRFAALFPTFCSRYNPEAASIPVTIPTPAQSDTKNAQSTGTIA